MSVRVLAGFALAGFLSVPVLGSITNAVDPQAETVLRSLSAYFLSAPSFKVDLEAETRIEAQDMKQEFTTHGTLAVKRPDKFAMTVRNGMIGSMLIACDGANLTAFLPAFNRYTVKPSDGSLDRLSRDMGASSPAFLPVIAALLERDPYSAFVKDAARVQYLGEEKRGDATCHHVKFFHKEFDYDAWIRTGPRPLLEAVKPCLTQAGCSNNMPPGMKTEVILNFKGWEVGSDLPDTLFSISLPAEAQKADTLCPGAAEKAPEEADPVESLRLKPAPVFKLPLLGGGEFDLAAQKGRSATVLCFWTTWAGPCRLTLPMLEKTAAAFKDKGVAFLSINQQESEEAIREFLQNIGVTIPVAIDRASGVAQLYRVEGIPQIVVIDPGGIVRDVYLGYGKTLEDDLRTALAALTAKPATVP